MTVRGAMSSSSPRPVSMPTLSTLRASTASTGSVGSPLTSPGTPPTSSLGSLDGSLGSLTSEWDEDAVLDFEDGAEATTTGCWGRGASATLKSTASSPMLSGRWAPLDADSGASPKAAVSSGTLPAPVKRPTFLNLRRSATTTMSAQKYSKLPSGSATVRLRRVSEWLSNTQAARDLWWSKLNEVVASETDHEPKSTNIQVVFYDVDTNIEYCKTLCVRPSDTVQRCIQQALEHLEMQSLDAQQFQLWAKTPGDDSPYPLVGHERPFAIRMSCLRDNMNQEEGFDLDHCNNMYEPLNPRQRCQFILRNIRQMAEHDKKKPKSRKSPMRLRQVFKRTKSEVAVDTADSADLPSKNKKGKSLKQRRSNSSGHDADAEEPPQGDLFGQPLQTLWRESPAGAAPAGLVVDDVAGELAKPIMSLLANVFAHGTATQGIFRRSANQRNVKELRAVLDGPDGPGLWGDGDYDATTAIIEKSSILTTSCLLKEFLRCLPVPLLVPDLCADWLDAHHTADTPQPGKPTKLQRYAAVLALLPRCHRGLLAYMLCLLHHVAANQDHNLMSPSNLGVVFAPGLLRAPENSPKELEAVLTATTPAIVAYLISHCQQLFGPAVTRLLGEPPPPQDSGAEESDSLHSGGLDSLEHLEPCPPPRKDKMSLSRDSGLTMSDSQLFTPDEEESGSTSSSGSGRVSGRASRPMRFKVATTTPPAGTTPGAPPAAVPAPSGCRQYVRVYGGWEERRAGGPGLYSMCSSPRTAQLPSATSTNTGGSPMASPMASPSATSTCPAASPFKREDWFRQRSALRRLASPSSPSHSPNYSPSYSPSSSPGPSTSSASQVIYGNLQGCPSGAAVGSRGESTGSEGPSSCSSASTAATTSLRTATHRRLDSARRERLRRSASEESLLERRARPHPPSLPQNHPGHAAREANHPPTRPPQPPQAERPLPALPTIPHRSLAPRDHRDVPRISRSRSAYHLASTPEAGSGRSSFSFARVYPLEAQAELDALYGYACVRSCGGGSATGSLGAVGADKSADDSYDSSTLSDDDSTPHVSRSNSRSKEPWSPTSTAGVAAPAAPSAPPPPLPPKLRHLPPVHVELGATMERRGRSRRRLPKPAARSKSLPPPSQAHRNGADGMADAMAAPASPPPYRPPPYRPPPSVVPSHRAPITTYYLGARANPNPSPNLGSSPNVSGASNPSNPSNPSMGPKGCASPSMGPSEEGESYV
ncbi:uncharacterized protein LOC117647050 isoform X2 [Thrips palmi]|uniref:Uncharacterized protein LOC117647050 isoform X2 n=1 Tax=Thrips palmi TaxID=161013 RepID=A0A6P8ZPN7_THRPL|nr:uncharacterized protein LOC117647050 isoform X2 [Thrips palmi]